MAFVLTNSERQQWFDGLLIPAVEAYNVSAAFVTTKTGIDAKVITIPGVGAITVSTYDGTDMTVSNVADAKVDVALDQAKYTNSAVESTDNFNSFMNVIPEVTDRTADAIADVIDTYTFGQLSSATNIVTGGTALTVATIAAFIGSLKVKLNQLKAPRAGRKLALPSDVADLLAQAQIGSGSDSIATEAGRTGYVTTYGGFDIYESQNLASATTGVWGIACVDTGAVMGIGYNEARVKELEGRFADAVQTLVNYGAKVIKQEFVVKADVAVA